jgi:hypothetical protein
MVRQAINGIESGNIGVTIEDASILPGTDESDIDASGNDGIPTIEPATITIEPEQFEGGKRRGGGRPKGSKNATGKQSTKEVSQDLSGLLLSAHAMLAAIVKTPELEIDEAEAKRLGDAVARVNREFGVQIMSPKTAAVVNLIMAAGTVYGPRVIAMKNNSKRRKAENVGATIH